MNLATERISIRPEEFYNNQTLLYNGLPMEQAIKACRYMYTHELAKVTIQISDPVVMTIGKRVSSTFSGQLGVVGKCEIYNSGKINNHGIFRWNYWAVHWNEHYKHNRGSLLDI